jgi:hypothetical protein
MCGNRDPISHQKQRHNWDDATFFLEKTAWIDKLDVGSISDVSYPQRLHLSTTMTLVVARCLSTLKAQAQSSKLFVRSVPVLLLPFCVTVIRVAGDGLGRF